MLFWKPVSLREYAVEYGGILCHSPGSLCSWILKLKTLNGAFISSSKCPSLTVGGRRSHSHQLLERFLLREEDLMKCLKMKCCLHTAAVSSVSSYSDGNARPGQSS